MIKILANYEVVFSQTQGLENQEVRSKNKNTRLGVFILSVSLISIIFLIILNNLFEDLKKLSYLYGRFQRKRSVAMKTGGFFLLIIIILGALPAFLISEKVPIIPIAGCFIVSFVFLMISNLKIYKWKLKAILKAIINATFKSI